MGASPAQLLFSRQLRSQLPISKRQLKPQVQSQVHQKLHEQQKRTELWYNKSATRRLAELKPGDNVCVKKFPGEQAPRSYLVRTADGQLRRTTQHLRLVSSNPQSVEIEPEFEYNLSHLSNQASAETLSTGPPPVSNPGPLSTGPPPVSNPGPLSTGPPPVSNPELLSTDPAPASGSETSVVGSESPSSSTEPKYQLIIPDWLYDQNYRTARGRIVTPPSRYQAT
ncbi:hypothetical protein FOCC_FOCC015592 [Frankliniella occidentalis]|nr:hypothetical protein FOCC_FOCC015592 [Frankliniella occidentalis]